MIRWLGMLLGAGLAGAAISVWWPRPVSSPPPAHTWRVRWGTVPNLIRITAPASTTLGREERILACAIPDVQRAWLASGRPPVYLGGIGRTDVPPLGPIDGYYFYPRTVPLGRDVIRGFGGDVVLTAAALQVGCPYEHAPWWGKPVPPPAGS
jgi:hypothetical protein